MIHADKKICYSHINFKNRLVQMGISGNFLSYRKTLLLAGTAMTITCFSGSHVLAQEVVLPPPEMVMEDDAPENILGDDVAVNEAESAPTAAAPANEELEQIDQQLAEMQKILDAANAPSDAENSLPVIDPENEPDLYYDSAPVRRGVQPTAPEKVDPSARPAGKIIYVQKDFDAGDDQSLLTSAKRALSLGRYDSALGFYEQLYAKNPRDARVLMGKAIALQNLGQVQTAIKTYEQLLSVDPDNLEAEVTMLGLVKTRFPALAIKRLLDLYNANPNNAGLNVQVGMTYADLGNTQEALRYMGSAVSLEPNNASYYYNLAVISDRAGKYKDAIKFYEEALSKDAVYGANRSVPRDAIYERLNIIRSRS